MEQIEQHVLALVGAGDGGRAILETLIDIKSYDVRYVCDIDSNAEAMILAKECKIQTIVIKNEDYHVIFEDPEVTLVFEVTGVPSVFDRLNKLCPPHCNILGASGTKIIFNLLDTQHKFAIKLEEHKRTLESKIISRTEEVEKVNMDFQEKIIEYEHLNELLMDVNDQKTKYLLQATHHLKAPFAAIESYADIVIDGYTGDIPEQTKDIMLKIKNRCGLLQKSIKEMLELASLKSTVEDNLKFSNVNINIIINKIIGEANILATSNNIKIAFETFSEQNLVFCNEDQVTIMLSILLDNAIKYSNENGEVDIRINKIRKNKISILISDEGIGIPQRNIGKIFDEYFRSNNAVSKHANGTGLGLAITKEIANLNNFSISVDSTENEGTTFSLIVQTINE